MKEILQEQLYWYNFIELIREQFGDDKLFFTFVPFKDEKVCYEYKSIFAKDNLEELMDWGTLMQAKLQSGAIAAISMIFRVFLSEKVIIYERRQKLILPKKELYHVLITPEKLILFTKEETEKNQNTDAITGKPLKYQKDLVYKSSIDLYPQLIKG